jgi:ABC-type transport system involved in multi-copper enzyme maturation permease subunit
MVTGIIAFAISSAVFMAAAWYVFRRKDILV